MQDYFTENSDLQSVMQNKELQINGCLRIETLS